MKGVERLNFKENIWSQEEVERGCRKLQKKELRVILLQQLNQDEKDGTHSRGSVRNAYKILFGKSQKKRCRSRCEDDIKTDLLENSVKKKTYNKLAHDTARSQLY